MAMKTTRRRPAVFGEWWWIRTTRCFLYLLLSFFLFLSSSSPLFCLLLLPNPPTASAIAFPDSDSGYSNRGGGNYSIFSYHLPESEDDFADVEDSTNMEDDWFGNDTMPWPEDDVTDSPLSSMDHVGDGLRNAEIIDDIDEEETGEEEKAGGEEGHSYGHEGEDADKEKGEEETAKDVVQQFLEEVERYENNKANCTAGTSHNLGKGVIKQYGLNRFKAQALVAVNRANFLTRIWKNGNPAILTSEYFFYTQVRSMLEGDSEIFAAGNCYDKRQFKDYYLFCPFAYRTASGLVNVKDLSVEYDYLAGNGSEWFETCRFKASRSHNVTLGKGDDFLSACCFVHLFCVVVRNKDIEVNGYFGLNCGLFFFSRRRYGRILLLLCSVVQTKGSKLPHVVMIFGWLSCVLFSFSHRKYSRLLPLY